MLITFLLQSKVYLIDFNPFGEVTDGVMFTWEELNSNKPLLGTENSSDENQVRITNL